MGNNYIVKVTAEYKYFVIIVIAFLKTIKINNVG